MSALDEFMLDVGLTDAQLRDRKTYIGGSAAKDIADGNWSKVYNRMVLDESEDLSRVFKVQLGHITEEFNLLWFCHLMDWQMGHDPSTLAVRHDEFPFLGCLPDRIMMMQDGTEIVVDAKHTAARAPWWDEQKLAEYYFPQAQHNMIVTGVHRFYLSVIFGNETPTPIPIEYDPDWAARYINLCTAFWGHVERRDPPIDGSDKIAIPKISLDDMRELDMTTSNMASAWDEAAFEYVENKPNAEEFEIAKKALKAMVPDDVKKAHGNGVEITRNKRGAMTVRTL